MGSKRKKESDQAQTQRSSSKKLRLDSDEKPLINSGSLTSPDFYPFIEKPKGDELKREVELYEKLASEDESQRINAADSIFAGLFEGDGASESTLLRHLERRLLRGLASGRKGARIGFGIVLTEIFSYLYGEQKLAQTKYANLQFERVFLLLKEKTKPEGDLSGQEIKDHALGLLFGLQSFVRAKILFTKTDHWMLVLEEIFGLAKRKPWIRQECGWMIIEALEQMDHDQVLVTLNTLCDQGLSKTPEGVGIWLTARNKYPLLQDKSLPKVWGEKASPLDQLPSLAKVLRESSEPEKKDEELEGIQPAKQTGNWNAKLHFVWDIILKQFTMMTKDVESSQAEFGKFWKIIVDENLFAHTASRERKFWGFLLFQKVLEETLTFSPFISSIFSQNLMRCLINHSQDRDRFLNRAAEKSLKSVINAVKSNRQLLPDVLRNLVDSHGSCNFDRITKTKTISQLLDSVTENNCKNVIVVLETVANEVHGDDKEIMAKEAESRRIMLGDNLLQIIRKPVLTQENPSTLVRALILKTLAKYAYTKIDGTETPISEKSRVLFRSRLMSALTHVLTDLRGYKYICDLLKECDPSAIEIDSSIENVMKNAKSNLRKILKKIKILKNDEGNIVVLQALAFLYSLMILQLYNGEPEAISCLDELDLCYRKFISEKMMEESKSQVLDILVELLLSLISKPSALMRKMAKFVFRAFVSQISETGLKLMTDILVTDESLRGQKRLFDEEELDISLDEVENNSDSDLEVIDMDADENSLNLQITDERSTTNPENSSDCSADDTDEEDMEETEKLNTALAAVLGRDPKTSADESDDDADMTDSEMLALDDKLVEIFSQCKRVPKKKKEEKSAKENICNFKTRVLDLIEIYVKEQAQNELAFSLIMPLLSLMHNTQNKSLADRSHAIIQSFAKVYKNSHPLGSDPVKSSDHRSQPPGRLEVLREIHNLACKDKSHALCKAASSASLLVVSSMYRVDVKFINDAANVYRDTQVKWVLGEACIQTAFFIEWVNWCQNHVPNLQKDKTR
ncbi:DNA polymerase V [Golovinomyces cichoracearum]|uniref:DNA polymerase V n=1 Tax=Golovinomyces cichoracearum TaxID=62708 RepID=A0A420ISE5_9PEZI|nr:DNA polymerase V [Golovinomyces cichoracearum]